MKRKSVLWVLGSVLLVGGVTAALILLVRHEPATYYSCSLPPRGTRKDNSIAFQNNFIQMLSQISYKKQHWQAFFTEEEINSYFEEDFVKSGIPLPEGFSEPRIAISPDKISLGFRYGKGLWSTVVSFDFRIWVTTKEPNVLALELLGMHAGSLPISAQSLLERATEIAQQNNIDMPWYRHNGHPVALVRFQSNRPAPTIQLKRLQIAQGKIRIEGRSIEAPPISTVLKPALGN